MTTLILDGHIQALQPITVSLGDEAPNKNVHLMPFFDATGQRSTLPCLPGHNIKGAIRSTAGMAALAEVYGADPADPQTWGRFTISQVYDATSGGLVGTEKNRAEDLLRTRRNRQRNAHFALFGMMKHKVKGQLEVDFAFPDAAMYTPKATRGFAHGFRRDVYRTDPDLLNRHSEEEIDAFVALTGDNKELSSVRTQIKAVEDKVRKLHAKAKETNGEVDAGERDALTAERKALDTKKAGLQKKGAEPMGRPLPAIEYIAAGVRLQHGMRVVQADDVVLGYFLRVMEHFSNQCRFGGHASTGFGQARLEYALSVREGTKTMAAGTLVVAPYAFELVSEHPAILRAQKAFAEAAKDPDRFFALDLDEAA